jgi:DNA invertase Pin-like site-specific DNA recombinase
MKLKSKFKPSIQAVLYVRVSSKGQEKGGFSIPAQLKLLRKYGDTKGFHIVKEFRDVETAKQSGREGFGEMVDFLNKNSDCKYLLVEKTDRLYRNFKDYVCLEEIDIEIHLVKEGAVVSSRSKSADKFIHGIKVLMAKNYVDNLSEETRKGMTEKAEQGIWPSVAPLGYKNVLGKAGKRIIKPDSRIAPLVIRLFKTYSSGGFSLNEITEKFKGKGFAIRKSKRPLPRSTVHKILTNQMYSGVFQWKGQLYEGKYTPLISKKLWEKVQGVLKRNSATKGRKY